MQAEVRLIGDVKTIATLLGAIAAGESGPLKAEVIATKVEETPPKAAGRGRPTKEEAARRAAATKAAALEEEIEVETDEPSNEDFGEIEETEDEEGEEPDEEPAPKKTKALDIDKDIIPAFQAYAKEHSREKAAKVLAKFKVKSVRDIPATKFADVLKLLKV